MGKTRILTIASMAAPGWVKINQIANLDMQFQSICGGSIKVTRSSDGHVYSWETNTDHIRIFVKMEGPTDLPFINYSSSGAGWFHLEGFNQIILGKTAFAGDNNKIDVEELAQLNLDDFSGSGKAESWD